MQLIVLAAGHGRRFGGLKQLAPVGPDGQALMDYTALDAVAAGFTGVVLIVRDEVRDELMEHIAQYWPSELSVEPVTQGPIAGTAQAVASARKAIDGSFGVVNADDLYGAAAIAQLGAATPSLTGTTHLIVGYRLAASVLNDAPVTRGVCEVGPDGDLVRIVEQQVQRTGDTAFTGKAIDAPEGTEPHPLVGDEVVSMNLWGFSESVFDELDAALDAFDPDTAPSSPGKPPELLLPSVVGEAVTSGRATVKVEVTEGHTIGLTHPDDLEAVREMIAAERHGGRS